MNTTKLERLQKFCAKLNIKVNDSNRGYCCYFTYKDNQYYADICYLSDHSFTECMIFPAIDEDVASWDELYRKTDIDVIEEELRNCILDFLMTL